MLCALPQAIERMKTELSPDSSKTSTQGEKKDVGTEGKEEEGASEGQQTGGESPEVEPKAKGGAEQPKEEEEKEEKKEIKIEYIPLDLSSFQSTVDCVRIFKEKGLPLHILINNAAVSGVPFSKPRSYLLVDCCGGAYTCIKDSDSNGQHACYTKIIEEYAHC